MSNLFGPPDTPENFFAGMAGPTGRLESLPGGDAGVKKTLKKMREFTREGSKDPNIRQLAMSIIRKCRVKDALCETKAVFKWVQENLRWTRDVDGVETLQKPARTLSPDWRAGDCLPKGTKLQLLDGSLASIENLTPSSVIMTGDGFGRVKAIVSKGIKPTLCFTLSNNCMQIMTGDHKVFLLKNGTPYEARARDVTTGNVIWSLKSQVPVTVLAYECTSTMEVYDIETTTGSIYLPESDWVVHNCDDLSMALAALLLSVGIGPVRFKVIAADPENPEGFSHVYLQVAMPTSHNQMAGLGDTGEVEWVSLDPSPPGVGFGWEHDKRFREGIFNV